MNYFVSREIVDIITVFYINYYASLRIHSLRNECYWNTTYGYAKRPV